MNKIKIPKGEYRLSITSACNMKCVYCHNEGNTEFSQLSIKDIDSLISNSVNVDLHSIRLTGGEPTVHPQFIEICKLIKQKYNLKLGVNTNGMDISKILPLAQCGYIDRIVVGLDYFNGNVSKNSPVGVSSQTVLNNILTLQQYCPDICIATVYSDNFSDIDSLTNFCLNNGIRFKIIEVVDKEITNKTSEKYLNLKNYIAKKYNLELRTSDEYHAQDQGFKDGKRVVSFYNSLHKLHDCKHCNKVNLRISSKGEFSNCLMGGKKSVDFRVGNPQQNIENALIELFNLQVQKQETNFERE